MTAKKEQDCTFLGVFGVLGRWLNPFHCCTRRQRKNNTARDTFHRDPEMARRRERRGMEVVNETAKRGQGGSELDGVERRTTEGNARGRERDVVGELDGGERRGAQREMRELDGDRHRGENPVELDGVPPVTYRYH